MTAYDIIGDVHGYAGKLTGLLALLGYRERRGAFRCSGRQAIFVGDLVDRGPAQRETVRIVRAMVDAGSAQMVLGNHEFNAISYATVHPKDPDDYLRTHRGEKGAQHTEDHQAFLDQFGWGTPQHREVLAWFGTLPLWLELDGFRVVHACWSQRDIDELRVLLGPSRLLTPELVVEGNTKGTPGYGLIDRVLKGPEVSLLDHGAPAFKDKGSHVRDRARIRWWDHSAATLRDVADIQHDATTEDGAPYPELPDVACDAASEFRYDDTLPPVFFGHYWRRGAPAPCGARTACVDYSAGADETTPLVAYRLESAGDLDARNFRWFPG